MSFNRSANDKQLSFKEVSAKTKLPVEEVDFKNCFANWYVFFNYQKIFFLFEYIIWNMIK